GDRVQFLSPSAERHRLEPTAHYFLITRTITSLPFISPIWFILGGVVISQSWIPRIASSPKISAPFSLSSHQNSPAKTPSHQNFWFRSPKFPAVLAPARRGGSA
uniref:Uncharacterized protein n=1 Tax=Triticum urartu TaxID=4572 RepID=A0A8R7TYK5_TRIUA